MRRSRTDFAAVSTALCAAASHDSVLVPITSVTRYTLSAIRSLSFVCWARLDQAVDRSYARPRDQVKAARAQLCGVDVVLCRHLQHLAQRGELDTRSSGWLTSGPFVAVDPLPALVRDHPRMAIAQQLEQIATGGIGIEDAAFRGIGEHQIDGFLRVPLVRSDHTRGAPLDPADCVLADHRTRLADDASALVGDRPALLV